MPIDWTIVGSTGYDVEDVDDPQTIERTCPSCERQVRFVEKQLIKNLRVFGVPLVGVERGRRVFECSNCRVCIEPPADASAASKQEDPALRTLQARVRKLEDELWLWNGRVDLARKHGDATLTEEALAMRVRVEEELETVRAELAAAEHPELPRAPAIVARPGAAVEAAVDAEFDALRRRLARRPRDEETPAPAEETAKLATAEESPATATEASQPSADTSAAFAALKARLASKPADETPPQQAEPAAADEPAPARADVAPAERPPDEPPAPSDGGEDDPVEALKRKLRPPRT